MRSCSAIAWLSCSLTLWVSGITLRLDRLALALRLGLATLLVGSITITSPLDLVIVIGEGIWRVFMVLLRSTPLGACMIELMRFILSLGWGR
jgi:hypothetical protein